MIERRQRQHKVSILAQPGGRALPAYWHQASQKTAVSILAQPGGRALLQLQLGFGDVNQPFQSSPSPGAGRCPLEAHRFAAAAAQFVSILAQPGGRALLLVEASSAGLPKKVSILAQPGGRALPSVYW